MKYVPKEQGKCWLCSKVGPLTREHIPPRSAFNAKKISVQQVSEHHQRLGKLEWEHGKDHHDGYLVVSLCSQCNALAGRSFAPPYTEFVRRVAEQAAVTPLLQDFTILKVKRPQLVLRQVIFQFVSANGSSFVNANPWIRSFLRRGNVTELPNDVFVYLFAVKSSFRTSGVSGHIIAGQSQIRILSEFTFPPLGTVLSWGAMTDDRLTPIKDWACFPFSSKQTVDINLRVNPVSSPSPVDFRLRSVRLAAAFTRTAPAIDVSLLPELRRLVQLRSGKEEGHFLTGHPSQAKNFSEPEGRH